MVLRMSPRHRALYLSVVADGAARGDAWATWSAMVPIHHADAEESQILPLLAQEWDIADFDEAQRRRILGLRRHASLRQFVVLQAMRDVTAAWHHAGIDAVAIKGVALADVYRGSRVRSMGDGDVLVAAADRDRAIRAAHDVGFRLGMGLTTSDVAAWADRFHAVPLSRPDGPDIDLHWRLSHQPATSDHATEVIFARSRSTDAGLWRIPAASHQLAIAVAHGTPATSHAGLRMMVDVAYLLRSGSISASEVDEVAGPHRLRAAVRDVVELLSADGVAGSGELLAELAPARWTDRLASRAVAVDRDPVLTRVAHAVAHGRPSIARRPTTSIVDLGGRPDARSSSSVCLAGRGWWLADGWATWSRSRVAQLNVRAASGSKAVMRLALAAPPSPQPRPTRVAVLSRRGVRIARLPDATPVHVEIGLGPPTGRLRRVWILTPRLVRPGSWLGNGDERALGVAVVGLS